MNLAGVLVAAATPFSETRELLVDFWVKHLEWLVASGVHGIVACGTTGEGPTLTPGERNDLLLAGAEVCKKAKIPFVVGCNSNSTAEVLQQMVQAHALGADAALVVTPYYNRPTREGILAHYQFLAEQKILPILLYNVPSRTNVTLTADEVQILLQEPWILGIKEATSNLGNLIDLSRVFTDPSKVFLAGEDDSFGTFLWLGAHGIVSAVANLIPKAFVQIYDAAIAGRWETVLDLQKRFYPLVHGLYKETNPAPLKYAMSHLLGFPPTLRLPLVSVRQETRVLLANLLRGLEISE